MPQPTHTSGAAAGSAARMAPEIRSQEPTSFHETLPAKGSVRNRRLAHPSRISMVTSRGLYGTA